MNMFQMIKLGNNLKYELIAKCHRSADRLWKTKHRIYNY